MRYTAILLFVISMVSFSYAAEMPLPKVEFSADTYMEADGIVMNGRLFQSKKKHRMEMNAQGTETVMIVRLDKNLSWMLMPEQKMFMQMSLEESMKKSNDMNACSVEKKAKGSETVNGIKTSKYSVKMSCPEEVAYSGNMWISKDDIVVKLDVSKTGENGASHLVSELRNIKVGKQPAALFEVPSGYQPMNIGEMFNSIGASMKAAQEQAERSQREQLERERRREAEKSARTSESSSGRDYTPSSPKGRDYSSKPSSSGDDGVVDTLKKVKGLFGW